MKTLAFLLVFFLSCSPALQKSPFDQLAETLIESSRLDDGCTEAPERVLGAVRAVCLVDPDDGVCCGYVTLVGEKGSELVCLYRACRTECEGEFHFGLATCQPSSGVLDEYRERHDPTDSQQL